MAWMELQSFWEAFYLFIWEALGGILGKHFECFSELERKLFKGVASGLSLAYIHRRGIFIPTQ